MPNPQNQFLMEIPIYQVDAFTNKKFGGNPAAVCPLNAWLSDEELQTIAAENNLSETAFFIPEGDAFGLRWFTPEVEVNLCGHATLATAYVIFEYIYPEWEVVFFKTKSGKLKVVKEKNGTLTLDFPTDNPQPIEIDSAIEEALGVKALEMLQGVSDKMLIVTDEAAVRNCKPNFEALKSLGGRGFIVTAKGTDVDFVSRFFAPNAGVNEDPVTGSAHCLLTPYWAEKLGKRHLVAKQVSKRGGDLTCEWVGERVFMNGNAVLYMVGRIFV